MEKMKTIKINKANLCTTFPSSHLLEVLTMIKHSGRKVNLENQIRTCTQPSQKAKQHTDCELWSTHVLTVHALSVVYTSLQANTRIHIQQLLPAARTCSSMRYLYVTTVQFSTTQPYRAYPSQIFFTKRTRFIHSNGKSHHHCRTNVSKFEDANFSTKHLSFILYRALRLNASRSDKSFKTTYCDVKIETTWMVEKAYFPVGVLQSHFYPPSNEIYWFNVVKDLLVSFISTKIYWKID